MAFSLQWGRLPKEAERKTETAAAPAPITLQWGRLPKEAERAVDTAELADGAGFNGAASRRRRRGA